MIEEEKHNLAQQHIAQQPSNKPAEQAEPIADEIQFDDFAKN